MNQSRLNFTCWNSIASVNWSMPIKRGPSTWLSARRDQGVRFRSSECRCKRRRGRLLVACTMAFLSSSSFIKFGMNDCNCGPLTLFFPLISHQTLSPTSRKSSTTPLPPEFVIAFLTLTILPARGFPSRPHLRPK